VIEKESKSWYFRSMRSTFHEDDVTVLLKDISGAIAPRSTLEREQQIQGGGHYSEMLPLEYEPTEAYMRCYEAALKRFAPLTARAVARLSRRIFEKKEQNGVLVSLARAGTTAGVLVKRFIAMNYACDYPHYTISIIRDRGIDHNAMRYILNRHSPDTLQFIDSWTGKGTVLRELQKSMVAYPGVCAELAVLSDPSHCLTLYGTQEDFLIPSACLNATVSGLMSRTVLNAALIGADDFHGAVFYGDLVDRTYEFIDAVAAHFPGGENEGDDESAVCDPAAALGNSFDEVTKIALHFGTTDVNLIKPGIGEATRVLLRRLPRKILVHSLYDDYNLGHLYQLAKEKGVPLLMYPLLHYRAVGIISTVAES
jgi:hypothetical protein